MAALSTAVGGADATRSECWCCGRIDQPGQLVHLGNHPEVEDVARTGWAIRVRDRLRRARRTVVDRGWHRSRVIGRPWRWPGNHLP